MHVQIVESSEQLQTCLQIRRAVFVEEQGVPVALEIDELDDVTAATHLQVTQYPGGPVVGTARVKAYNDTTAKIQRVAILAQYRSAGYGSAVMLAAEAAARARGFTRVLVDAQLSAEGFYGRLGYMRVSDAIFLDAGIEHVRMDKSVLC